MTPFNNDSYEGFYGDYKGINFTLYRPVNQPKAYYTLEFDDGYIKPSPEQLDYTKRKKNFLNWCIKIEYNIDDILATDP